MLIHRRSPPLPRPGVTIDEQEAIIVSPPSIGRSSRPLLTPPEELGKDADAKDMRLSKTSKKQCGASPLIRLGISPAAPTVDSRTQVDTQNKTKTCNSRVDDAPSLQRDEYL